MDSVVVLVAELRGAEQALDAACRKNAQRYSRERGEQINQLLKQVQALYRQILDATPATPEGAGVLIRIISARMPASQSRYSNHLNRIADRLEAGERLHADLVWLRALAEALSLGAPQSGLSALGPLVKRAVSGAARPMVVHHAPVLPAARPAPDWQDLALGPN